MGRIVLVTGGCRSGKSDYALRLALGLPGPRVFVATCPVTDDEMRRRIEIHRQARQAQAWITVEEQIDLAGVLARHAQCGVLLVDCITLWINNLLYAGQQAGRPTSEADVGPLCAAMLDSAASCRGTVVLVTNEVGLGIVPADGPTRLYRDLVGRANQTIAARADAVTLVCCGIPLHLKPQAS